MGHAHDSHRPFKFPPTRGGADGRRSAGRWTITPQLSRALGTACMGDARAHGGVPTPRAPVAAFSAGKRLGAQIFHGSGSSHLQTGRRAGSHPRRNTSPPPHPVATLLERGGGHSVCPKPKPHGSIPVPVEATPSGGQPSLIGNAPYGALPRGEGGRLHPGSICRMGKARPLDRAYPESGDGAMGHGA